MVLNLETGAVVFVGQGKGAEALEPFWKRLRRARARVEAVATDMSIAYILAIREHLGNAVHVFDHFHVIKLFNDKLSDFRRELYREATDTGKDCKVVQAGSGQERTFCAPLGHLLAVKSGQELSGTDIFGGRRPIDRVRICWPSVAVICGQNGRRPWHERCRGSFPGRRGKVAVPWRSSPSYPAKLAN